MAESRPWRVLVLLPLGEELIRGLFAPLGDAIEVMVPASRDRAGLQAALSDAELVVGDYTGQLALDSTALEAAPRLAFVQMPQVGVDSCDMPTLTSRGIPVANTAGANARSVAEWAVGAAFTLCRQLAWADRAVRAGEWPQAELLSRGPREIHTLRVGVLGYGAIGAQAAGLFAALGCPVSYWSRRRRTDAQAEYKQIDDLLATSDVLVVALPLTEETAGLLGPERLELLPEGALLVNVARGGIAPDDAVLAALESGRLAGAALDVFETEPLPPDHPLRSHPKVLLSPHVAGATGQAQLNIISLVRDNIAAVAKGEPVRNVVNGVAPLVRRHRSR